MAASREQLIEVIRRNPELALNVLEIVVNDVETEGCEDCGTISLTTINAVRNFLGMDTLLNIDAPDDFDSIRESEKD